MSQNNTIVTKQKFQDLPSVPANQKLTATEFNQLTAFQKSPVQQIAGSLDDTDIIIDGTKNYATTIVEAGATRTITANATGHSQGNNIKQRYTFDQDCTITLSGFDTLGNNTGTIAPIPAGTYDFRYIANRNGRNLEISQNIAGNKLDKTITSNQSVESVVEFKRLAHANNDSNAVKAFTATPTFAFSVDGQAQQMTLTGNVTSFQTSGEVGSSNMDVYLINDGTSGRTVVAPTGWTADPTSETHTEAANAINRYQFYTLPNFGTKFFNLHIVKS